MKGREDPLCVSSGRRRREKRLSLISVQAGHIETGHKV